MTESAPDTALSQELSQRAIQLLAELVGFNSVSALSNLPVIEYIEGHLKKLGIATTRIPSEDGTKSNIIARIGPEVAGGIVLSGHTDVVPVEGQAWDTDPFTLTEKGGKLYGRGSADMKGFIAICLAMAPEFLKLNLAKPIYFAFSYDEEVGCLGVPHILNHIDKHIPKPSFAIIGEPTMMRVVTAHKGVLSFETTVRGLEWHSSQPHYGVNAVQYACELVTFLMGMAEESVKSKNDERFDPPYSTVHVGIIHGGTARNIIPKECHFNWEIRPLPGEDPDKLVAKFKKHCDEMQEKMRKIFAGASIESRPMSRMHGVQLPADAAAARELVMRCAKTNQEHAVAFGTEAGVFNDHGVPAIVCGPGNIEQAHKPNEFIDISQIGEGVDFMLRLTHYLPVAE